MQIKTRIESDNCIIELFGEIDLDSSPQVRKTIIPETQKKHSRIFIDLSGVTYMDSSGIATLVEGLQYSRQYQGKFCIVGLSSGVREVFELSRLDKVFTIYNSLTEALEQTE